MVKKGVGDWQLDKMESANQTILKTLVDGKWHRYQELHAQTGLSSATLSKHLKELEEGIVEKKMILESGEYPYPVVYRIKEKHQPVIKKLVDRLGCTVFTVIRFGANGMKVDVVQKKLETANTALAETISEAYKIYSNDQNWKAFQQTSGTALACYNDALGTIIKKDNTTAISDSVSSSS